jgi:hypothetical protein
MVLAQPSPVVLHALQPHHIEDSNVEELESTEIVSDGALSVAAKYPIFWPFVCTVLAALCSGESTFVGTIPISFRTLDDDARISILDFLREATRTIYAAEVVHAHESLLVEALRNTAAGIHAHERMARELLLLASELQPL